MDRILKDLFGANDEPAAVPAAAPSAASTETAAPEAERRTDAEREARREARRQRKADPDRKRQREDFVDRYTSGDPSEGFTTEEAITHLREMRDEMTPAEFRAAMQQTLEHLPPNQRDDFVNIMQQYKAGQPASSSAAAAAAPAAAANPFGGLLTGLMGGGGAAAGGVGVGDLLDDLSKGGLRSPSQSFDAKPTEQDFQELLNSPLARAVLGGVAAYGMQQMQGAEDDHDTPGDSRART